MTEKIPGPIRRILWLLLLIPAYLASGMVWVLVFVPLWVGWGDKGMDIAHRVAASPLWIIEELED